MRNRLLTLLGCSLFSWNVLAHAPFLVVCTKSEINWDKASDALMQWRSAHDTDMSCDNTEGWQAIRIKYRGASSKSFAKKQYGLEIIDAKGDKSKCAMGSMPEASDWTLRSPYIDRSFIRDALAYNIGRDMGHQLGYDYAAPRTELVELAVDGDYRGIFTLTERIGRGPQHVPIEKLDVNDLKGLTYIAEISSRDYHFKSKKGTMINFIEPGLKNFEKLAEKNPLGAELIQARIREEVNRFEAALKSDNFKDPIKGYRPFIDMDSFVDFFIVQELSKNVDGFRRSEFFYKGTDGKFHMGPLWDFDIAFGNLDFAGAANTKGWAHRMRSILFPYSFWFKRLLKDPSFASVVRKRYFDLRKEGNFLSWTSLEARIDTMTSELGDAPQRDIERWKDTQKFYQEHMMNTHETSDTFEGNIQILKRWMQGRLSWLDRKMRSKDLAR